MPSFNFQFSVILVTTFRRTFLKSWYGICYQSLSIRNPCQLRSRCGKK